MFCWTVSNAVPSYVADPCSQVDDITELDTHALLKKGAYKKKIRVKGDIPPEPALKPVSTWCTGENGVPYPCTKVQSLPVFFSVAPSYLLLSVVSLHLYKSPNQDLLCALTNLLGGCSHLALNILLSHKRSTSRGLIKLWEGAPRASNTHAAHARALQ